MASPNSEQLLAIEHHGGVLLKAGAGSGKTFVLKEHMIYLSKEWVKEYKSGPVGDFDSFIKSKFRKVVLMTFTKKAAGELEIRLNAEFEEALLNSEEDQVYWEAILQNLGYLNVSTIHGFCFKLIKQGFFKGISADQEILTESEFKESISEIFEKWLLEESHKNTEIYDIIIKDKGNVLNSILAIFSDPTLRNNWKQTQATEIHVKNSDEIVNDLFKIHGLTDVFEEYFSPEDYSEFQGKKWYEFLVPFCEMKRGVPLDLAGIIKIHEYLDNMDYKIPPKPSLKTVPEPAVEYYEKVKALKDFLKKNGEHFLMYNQSFDSRVVPWFSMIKELIDYVDIKYAELEGVTFSDLEYLVYQGLKDEASCKLVSEQYEYFIIDEFQDTSHIQFSIVEKIINSNYNKLFCVGDLKQAIYGFRGGELGVFLGCQEKIPKNLTLNNNYRSDKDVINFNNVLFDYLFEKGLGFKGIDTHRVPVDYQTVPDTKEDQGSINELNVSLCNRNSEEKLSNAEVDYYEALTMLEQIKANHSDDEESAILFKRLKPSLILIDHLIQNNIGFTAQIKIPFLEDPIIGIFYHLISYQFDSNEKRDEYLLYSLKAYISLLGHKNTKVVNRESVDFFTNETKYFGLYQAFCNFIDSLGIKNSNYKNNLDQIVLMLNTAKGNSEKLLRLLLIQRESSYSLDFQFGEKSHLVKIMTAHASKGLQFKHVFLGGMYTNENSVIFKSTIGKLPLSFKWSDSIHGKKKFKTPLYMFEEELVKNKDFSEAKRLFYVANTRAETSLSYVQIDFDVHKRMKSQSGSWINGLNLWKTEKLNFDGIKEISIDVSGHVDSTYLEKMEVKPPLFHVDNLGIECIEQKSKLVYLPEISITKLATVTQCPKKFYFQNVCKISHEEMELIEEPTKIVHVDNNTEDLSSSNVRMSGATRGSFIHETLSKLIIDGLTQTFTHEDKYIQESIQWTVEKLKEYLENYNFISEKSIKFELLNYMVSGIPDLIISSIDESRLTEIWDFKTGKYSESKLTPYNFQLMSYAHALYNLKKLKEDQPIKLVLCFVDDKKLVEQTVSKINVENYLIKELENLRHPEIENTEECEFCPYKTICLK
jgi:ATP-dependent exoDNAse (exonuclease V) beta subunit